MLYGVPGAFRGVPRFQWYFRDVLPDVTDVTRGSMGFQERLSDAQGDFFYFRRFSGNLRSFRGRHVCSVGLQGLQRGVPYGFQQVSGAFQG